MRIVHCITGLSGDGAQRMLLRLVEQLQEQGVTNYVVSLSGREPFADRFEDLGVPVSCAKMRGHVFNPAPFARLRKIIEDARPDIMQGWMYHANLALSAIRASGAWRGPVLWNIRRGMDDYHERKLLTRMIIRANRFLSRGAQRIIYCTEESRSQHEAFGFKSGRGIVIGNGFDTSVFTPSAEKRRYFRKRLGMHDTDIVVGNIGRDDSAKGRQYLFKAFSSLVERVPRARLLLVGRGMSESNPELRRNLMDAGIASQVIAVGEYSPLSDLYPALDILCSSSVNEGFPNVVGEAMACEVPCVVTDTGNARALVGESGVVVPSRSASSLARALGEMCEEPVARRQERGVRGRGIISERHSLASITQSYLSLYGEVLRGEPGCSHSSIATSPQTLLDRTCSV